MRLGLNTIFLKNSLIRAQCNLKKKKDLGHNKNNSKHKIIEINTIYLKMKVKSGPRSCEGQDEVSGFI